MLDGAVLACRIHGLEDEQHRPAVLRIEHVLQYGERFDAGAERFLGGWLVFLLEPAGVAGIKVLEPESIAVLDAIGLGELPRRLDDFVQFHDHPQLIANRVAVRGVCNEAPGVATI